MERRRTSYCALTARYPRDSPKLDLDLSPELDYLRRRNVEVVSRSTRITCHSGKQSLAPQCHPHTGGGNDGDAAQQEPSLRGVRSETALLAKLERLRNVWAVHESKVDDYTIKPMTERLNLHPFARGHPRNLPDDHGEEHNAFVQHLVAGKVA